MWLAERLRNDQQNDLARRGDDGVRRCVIFGDDRGTVRLARVIDEESGIGRELRMKSEPQQTLLAAEEHLGT